MTLHDDSSLVDLPHPVRVDAAFGRPMEETLFGPDFWTALKPYLGDDTLPTEWILNHAPGVYELARDSSNFPGTVNLGLLSLVLARARLRAHGDPILQVHPALHEQLLETDLGTKLPVDLFRLPYTAAFIEFGRPSGLSIFNPASGEHEVEGAYVGSYQVGPNSFIFEKDDRRRHLGLDPEKPTRVIEIVLTGSPRGKANALDDASQNVALFLQGGDADLGTAIERHFAFYRLPSAGSLPGFVPPDERERASFEKAVYQLAKVMLYLNLPEAEQAGRPDRSELLQRLRGLGPKKAARLQRKLSRAYDRIVIGGRNAPEYTLSRCIRRQRSRQRASALAARALPTHPLRRGTGGEPPRLDPAGARQCGGGLRTGGGEGLRGAITETPTGPRAGTNAKAS